MSDVDIVEVLPNDRAIISTADHYRVIRKKTGAVISEMADRRTTDHLLGLCNSEEEHVIAVSYSGEPFVPSEPDPEVEAKAERERQELLNDPGYRKVQEVNAALDGLLQINDLAKKRSDHYAKGGNNDERLFVHVRPYDDVESDTYPTIDFTPEWGEYVDEHGGSVGEAVLHHLRWVIEEHQRTLEEATQRLQAAGLAGQSDGPSAPVALSATTHDAACMAE